MITISPDNDVVTTINVFTVPPEHQERLLEGLIKIATQVAKTVPGFLSANFHKSTDGTRVVNYAQFASLDALQAAEAKIRGALSQTAATELRNVITSDFHAY
jgi:antibiotic biosynthesis monooxygenase (ABM) superfamily enzyme